MNFEHFHRERGWKPRFERVADLAIAWIVRLACLYFLGHVAWMLWRAG